MVTVPNRYWRLYLLALLSVALSAGVTVAGYKATRNTERLRVKLAHTQYDVTRLDSIVRDMKAYRLPIETVMASVPGDYRDVSLALVSFERAAEAADVGLEMRLDDEAKPAGNGLKTVLVTIQATGTYQAVRTFLSAVSRLPLHTYVVTMTVDTDGGNVGALITMNVSVR